MKWDDIKTFLALAASGTLASAAKATGQDATTIARGVQRLESVLGATLFEHGRAGFVLSEAGRRLLVHAEAMELGARAIQQKAKEGSGLSGTVRLSVSEGFGTHFLAPRLASFAASNPKIAIDLVASTGFLNPSRREADVAIMLARPRGGPLVVAKLTDYDLGVYAGRNYLERHGRVDSLDALRGRRLVGYIPDLIYAPELRYLAELDEALEPTIRSSSINAQASLIASGGGCGILPCFIGDRLVELTRVLPGAVNIKRSFWLVSHQDMRRVARIEAFILWLRSEVLAAQPLLLGAKSITCQQPLVE